MTNHGNSLDPKSERVGRLTEMETLIGEIDGRLGEASGRIHGALDRIGAPNPPMQETASGSAIPGREPKDLPIVDRLYQELVRVRRMVFELEHLAGRLEQLQ